MFSHWISLVFKLFIFSNIFSFLLLVINKKVVTLSEDIVLWMNITDKKVIVSRICLYLSLSVFMIPDTRISKIFLEKGSHSSII